jgi:hypothetical protein
MKNIKNIDLEFILWGLWFVVVIGLIFILR